MMAMVVMFIMMIINGCMPAIILLTLMVVRAKSRFAWSKRRLSRSSRLKARITRIPVRFSLKTKLTLSSLAWMERNRGTMNRATPMIVTNIKGSTTTRIQARLRSRLRAMMMPPMHMRGE